MYFNFGTTHKIASRFKDKIVLWSSSLDHWAIFANCISLCPNFRYCC